MISAVALARAAGVSAAILRIARRKTAQTVGRQQMLLNFLDDALSRARATACMRKADRKDLVRTDRGSGGAPLVTSYRQPAFSFQNRRLKLQLATVAIVAVALLRRFVAELPARSSMMHSALYQSAWISTGLPRRGVTTQSPTLASIHVSCTPGSPRCQQPVSVHLDAVARAAHVPGDDVGEHRIEFVPNKVVVAGVGEVCASGFEEPERGVDGVVLGRLRRRRESGSAACPDRHAARTCARMLPRDRRCLPVASVRPGSAIIVSRPQSLNQ